MNYMKYIPTDVVNGEGTRCVLFVSGCSHGCDGCYNEAAWNPKSGHEFTQELEDQIIKDLQDTRIKRKGITLTGGDPMHKQNAQRLIQLCHRIRLECPGKDIWLYTGYKHSEILADRNPYRKALLGYVDVLVDGKFEKDLYDAGLKFRGSSNQNIIYLGEA
ncbi:anaerobic ribonucleotide reductase-activating protein [Vibrio phage KIT04]|nr:anaerobic ribonucleotide reductase-activating protein [Vibrio phage KIT04]